MGGMIRDLRITLRQLMRAPAFTITVIVTLGLGIGLNAAMFTVVDCVLLRPLGYKDADRIVQIKTHFNAENRSIASLGGDDYTDVAKQIHGLEATAFYQWGADGISLNGTALYLPVATVSSRFGEVMGVQPLAGRLFDGNDGEQGALVGGAFAKDHFPSAAAAIGQPIRYDGGLYTIVGVLPEGFTFPGKTQVWVAGRDSPKYTNRTAYNDHAIGKRRVGVSAKELATEFAVLSTQLQRSYVEDAKKSLEFVPLQEQIVGRIRPTLNLLMGSVGVILLIVCANISHLQLVRATQQLRGVTVRTALGASRTSLTIRALMEAAVLGLTGSVAAVLLAFPVLRLLVAMAPAELPRVADVRPNGDVFAYACAVSMAVMALTAVLPVWRSWHIEPANALRGDATRGMESRGSVRLRSGLIVAEVALTLMLSVAATLLSRWLMAQSRQDLGFAAESLVTLDTHAVAETPAAKAPDEKTPEALAVYETAKAVRAKVRLARLDRVLEDAAHTPGVISAGAIMGAPMGFDGSDVGYAVKGRQVFAPPYTGLPDADLRPVTPQLFAAMGIPLLRGRGLDANDREGSPTVLLINQTLARTIFPNEDPVGKQVMTGFDDTVTNWWTIVGVVGDIRSQSPATPPSPTMYVPVAQHPGAADNMQLVVRTTGDAAAMAETLRTRLNRLHPEFAVKATTMRENIGGTQRGDRFRSVLFGSFAGLSLLLAAIGMYGVTAYTVAQRQFEFGLRFALGADRGQVLGMVLGRATAVAAVGIAIGIVLSVGMVRVLSGLLGKLPAFDVVSYALAVGAVLVIALMANLLPARRAARTDPMRALRSE